MKLTLIDGSVREFEDGLNGLEVAQQIATSLAKKVIAVKIDDVLQDFRDPINKDCKFEIVTKEDKEALEVLNHSCAHVMAQAIKHLYKDASFAYGPAVDGGYYYDLKTKDQISENDFKAIEKEMSKIIASGVKIEKREVSKEEAKEIFKDQPFKLIHIDELEGPITVYTQGDFSDLCKGPHVANVALIKGFKLMSIAGAYFKGDKNNEQLTRIYGTAFFSKEDLANHLAMLEEAKKRDHKKLGKELDLFMMSEYAPGMPFFLPNGMILRNVLENFWYEEHTKEGYLFVKTPIMMSKELWETSGHWANYKENMYTSMVDDREFAIKPMNCPGGMLVYKNSIHSYKDLPLRIGELGQVHRHEASGALNGLFRVRTFTQDDAHLFMTPDQIESEVVKLIGFIDRIYKLFNLPYEIELSTRPEEKYIGDIAIWDKSEAALAAACRAAGKSFKVNPGDGAFYGPKLDFHVRDSLGRVWQCGTIQLDMNLPERFDLTYVDQNGEKVRPVMLHRVIFGSIERFIGILIEHFAGAFPTWIAPQQVKILPVNNAIHMDYAKKVNDALIAAGIRSSVDDREEKVGYKLREAQVKKIPYTLVIGDKEMEEGSVTYRILKTRDQITVSLEDFIKLIREDIDTKRTYRVPEETK